MPRPRTVTHHYDQCLTPGMPGCTPVRLTGSAEFPVREVCARCVWLEDMEEVEVDVGLEDYAWLDTHPVQSATSSSG